MSLLSLTFHVTSAVSENWKKFIENELKLMIENLIDVEKYICSEVESEMINEGKNYNLLLTFEDSEKRTDFLDFEMKNITEHVENKFNQEVMVFVTFLNPIYSRL